MKILFVHNYYQFSGGEGQVLENEKDLLEKNGHFVHVYSRTNTEIADYSLFQKIFFFFESFFSFKTARDINRICKTFLPDVADVFNTFPLISPSVYWTLRRNEIPIIQTINNFRFLCVNGVFLDKKGVCEKCKEGNLIHAVLKKCHRESFLISLFYALIILSIRKIFMRKICAFLVSNEFVKQKYIEGGFPPEKIAVKPNFLSPAAREFKAKEPKERYIIFMGRLSREKGIYTLVRAMKYCPSIKLKILGIGPEFNALEKLLKKENLTHVELLGYASTEIKDSLLSHSDFLIFPSDCYENFPLTILEAYECGIPVVGSGHGAMLSLIEDHGTGLLFRPGDEKDLAQKIKSLWEKPELRGQFSENARKKIENEFSPLYNYQTLMDVYQKAISAQREEDVL